MHCYILDCSLQPSTRHNNFFFDVVRLPAVLWCMKYNHKFTASWSASWCEKIFALWAFESDVLIMVGVCNWSTATLDSRVRKSKKQYPTKLLNSRSSSATSFYDDFFLRLELSSLFKQCTLCLHFLKAFPSLRSKENDICAFIMKLRRCYGQVMRLSKLNFPFAHWEWKPSFRPLSTNAAKMKSEMIPYDFWLLDSLMRIAAWVKFMKQRTAREQWRMYEVKSENFWMTTWKQILHIIYK